MDSLMPNAPELVHFIERSNELEKLFGPNHKKYARFIVAALGSFGWIGGVLGASANLQAEREQGRENILIKKWLEEHQQKIDELAATFTSMAQKLDQFGEQIEERLQDESYLSLVRQGFRVWNEANTQSKKDYVRRTLTNAAVTKICPDDIIRNFINWIEQYDEIHFKIMRVLFNNKGATRALIWDEIGGEDVREDSPQADLFKLCIHDLSTGHVLRQIRDKNAIGQFLKRRRSGRMSRQTTLESAFEDTKPYELTALGEQFATYVLNETLPQIK